MLWKSRKVPLYEWSAYYNSVTRKVENCVAGSRTWHHEDRHRQQYDLLDKKLITPLGILSMWAIILAVSSLMFGNYQNMIYGVAALTPVAALLILFELDAEIYAWRKFFTDVSVRAIHNKH